MRTMTVTTNYLNILKQKYKGKKVKNPKGGLTAAGRKYFKKKEGANLKPGVKGKADTPEKKRRKGSFLTRFYTNPRGPMKDKKGNPTRLALAARAWGESAPTTRQQAQKLAAKGRRMLDRYQASKKSKKVKKFISMMKEYGGGPGAGGGAGTVATTTAQGSPGFYTPTFGRYNPKYAKKKPLKSKGENQKYNFTYKYSADDFDFTKEDNPRIPRKKGQPAKSKKHSDLYTDEDPKGTIQGLGFKNEAKAKQSVKKIKGSDRTRAHKVQAAVAMEQRAKAAGKASAANEYRKFINSMKKK